MEKKFFYQSALCSGSDLNHRTFLEDESWNSLMSTVLAGDFGMTGDSEKCNNNLTTVDEENFKEDEESSYIIEDKDESLLNRNIDAISNDEEVYFDCPSAIISPNIYSKNSVSPLRGNAPYIKHDPLTTNQYLTANFHSANNCDTSGNSGLDEERTGALLAQALDEFNEMKFLAESTPKYSSSEVSGSFVGSMQNLTNSNGSADKGIAAGRDGTSGLAASKKKLHFPAESRPPPTSSKRAKVLFDVRDAEDADGNNNNNNNNNNKENYREGGGGGGSKLGSAAQMSRAHARPCTPAARRRPCRVAAIKEYFETRSRIADHSGGGGLARKPGAARSPRYHTHEAYKLLKSSRNPNTLMRLQSPRLTSQRRGKPGALPKAARSSSCSDYSEDSLAPASKLGENRSGSTGDLPRKLRTSARTASRASSGFGAGATTLLARGRAAPGRSLMMTAGRRESPKHVSDITKRQSVGFVSSPILPVKEIRKIFSPSGTFKVNKDKKIINKHVSMVNKRLVCPKITVSRE